MFCAPVKSRGRAVDIRYANELGCIELVLLGIKESTNSMFSQNICIPYICTNQATVSPRVELCPPEAQVGLCVLRSIQPLPSPPLSLLACKIKKHISGEESWAELRFWIQSSF